MYNSKIPYIISLFAVLILTLTSGKVSAQDEFDLDIQSAFEPFFFLDDIGFNMAMQDYRPDTYVDEETYQLGPHDMLSVDVRGGLTLAMRGIIVNIRGDITLPTVGSISVKDMTLKEAREAIEEHIDENYQESEVYVTLDKPRNFHVYVHGDVPNPGKYAVPPQTRVDQAIFQAIFEPQARPDQNNNEVGSYQYDTDFLEEGDYALRNIRIESAGEDKTYSADLISYFRAGDKTHNPYVGDGDVIIVNESRDSDPRVSISGAVRTPQELEFRYGDSIEDLVSIAGGLTQDADTTEVKVHRNTSSGIETKYIDPDSDQYSAADVRPNDRIIIPVDPTLHRSHSAWIHGEVKSPGNFPIQQGETTLAEVFEKSGGLTEDALPQAAYLLRDQERTPRNLRISFLDRRRMARTSDQLEQGFEYLELEEDLNRNEVYVDLNNPSQLENVKVYDGDQLFVPKDENAVFVMGQVNQPGYYGYDNPADVQTYIEDAGGFSLAAEESRVFVIKAGSRSWHYPEETDIESGDIIFVDREPFDELQAQRTFELQQSSQRNSNIQLVMAGLSTITSIITTYVAITR